MNYRIRNKVNNIYTKVAFKNYLEPPFFVEYYDYKSEMVYVYNNNTTPKLCFNNYAEAENYIMSKSIYPVIITMDFRDTLKQRYENKNTT